jgi:superfamily II DNA helicase RecQ
MQDAMLKGQDLWKTVQTNKQFKIIFLSPEQLRSDKFKQILEDNNFWSQIYILRVLGVDKCHLLLSWGASFRKPF